MVIAAPTPPPGAVSEAPATEVTVKGRKPDPGQMTLGGGEVRQVPGAFGDAFRAIEALPGVVACGGGGSVDGAHLYCLQGNSGACGCGYSTAPSAGDPETSCPPATQTPGWLWYCASTDEWPASTDASCNCGAYACIDDSAVPAMSSCSCGAATPGVTVATACAAAGANDACCLGADGTCTCYYGTNSCAKAGDMPVSVASCDAKSAAMATMAAMKGTPRALPNVVAACH